MGQVTVSVNGQRYKLACRDGEEERLSALARFVDSRVNQLAGSMGNIGDARLLLMACLVIADELHEAKDRSGEAPLSAAGATLGQDDTRKLDHLVREIEDIAAALGSA